MSILNLVEQYNAFQQKVGSSLNNDFDEEISLLFTENFRKIANGSILVDGRSHLKKQLEDIKAVAGSWEIKPKEQLACLDKQRCVMRYHLISKNLGTFDIVAMLKSDKNGLLEEVDEVFYQVNSQSN